jgi:hypothetical protein
MMRCHLTHPDIRLVHIGKAARMLSLPAAGQLVRRPALAVGETRRLGGLGMEPTRLFPIIVLLSLVTVEYGGWALLGFLTGHGTLGAFRERFFRAGHAHAGVLLVLSLAYFVYLGRAGYSASVQWLAGALLLTGVLAQSGGFFVHLGLGQQGRSTPGTVLTRCGALLIAAALIILAIGLITHG